MRIIFSRKGFDSRYGGCPSPILDGAPISLPIPTRRPAPTTYGHLRWPVPELVADLTRGKLTPEDQCHLDPDLDPLALPTRPAGWRGALGQVLQAQKHLLNQGVGPCDIFLFWGLFQSVHKHRGAWRYTDRPVHAIFGWLQVQDVISNPGGGPLNDYPWLSQHPHTQLGWSHDNTIYVAQEKTTAPLGAKLPGFGLFRRPFQLTSPDAPSPSIWRVPGWLHPSSGGTAMTYHPRRRWLEGGKLRATAPGQEFVANVTLKPEALEWTIGLIENHQ